MDVALIWIVEVAHLTNTGDEVTRDWRLLHQFELDLVRRRDPDQPQNLRIFEGLYEEARHLGILPLKDPLDGFETDLKVARVINLVREDPNQSE